MFYNNNMSAIEMTKIALLSVNTLFPGQRTGLWYVTDNFIAPLLFEERVALGLGWSSTEGWYLIIVSYPVDGQNKLANNEWYVFKTEPRADADIGGSLLLIGFATHLRKRLIFLTHWWGSFVLLLTLFQH